MRFSNKPFWLLLSSAASVALTLAAAPFLTRMLGPEGRGTAYTILAISAILSAILSGGSSTTLRIAFLEASGRLGAKFLYQLVLATVILVFTSALYLLTPWDKILTSHQATLMVMATAVLALMASFTSEIMVGACLGRVALRNLFTSLAIFGLASTSILFVGELGFLVSVAILFCVLLESNLRKMNASFLKLRPSLGLATEAWRDLFVRPMK